MGQSFKESSLNTARSQWTEDTFAGDFTVPRNPKGGVDFATLGNLLSAKVIEESVYASYVDPVYGSHKGAVPVDVKWRFVTTRKGVVILDKERKGSICRVMGRAVCDGTVADIGEILNDYSLRYEYDPMLKSVVTVEKISETDSFYYAVFEAKRCLVSAQMEFCFYGRLAPVDSDKFVYALLSMSHPNCPPSKSIPRGKLLYGTGLLVEPYSEDPSKSLVTQVTQMDLGGLPRVVYPMVMSEQPMIVASLRSYVKKLKRATAPHANSVLTSQLLK